MSHSWSDLADFDGLAAYLRKLYPRKTARQVAADTGLPMDSVKKWLNGETRPCGGAVLALWHRYGNDLMRAAVKTAPEWYDDEARAKKIAALKAEIAALESRRR